MKKMRTLNDVKFRRYSGYNVMNVGMAIGAKNDRIRGKVVRELETGRVVSRLEFREKIQALQGGEK